MLWVPSPGVGETLQSRGMAGPPVFSGISFQPSDSTEGCMRVCHECFFVFHVYKCAPIQTIMHICVCCSTHAPTWTVYVCVYAVGSCPVSREVR